MNEINKINEQNDFFEYVISLQDALWKYYHNKKITFKEQLLISESSTEQKLYAMKFPSYDLRFISFKEQNPFLFEESQISLLDKIAFQILKIEANIYKYITSAFFQYIMGYSKDEIKKSGEDFFSIFSKVWQSYLKEKYGTYETKYAEYFNEIMIKYNNIIYINNQLIKKGKNIPIPLLDEVTKKNLLGYAMFCWYETKLLDFDQAILLANTSNQEKINAMDFFAFPEKQQLQNSNCKKLIK